MVLTLILVTEILVPTAVEDIEFANFLNFLVELAAALVRVGDGNIQARLETPILRYVFYSLIAFVLLAL